ISSAGSWLPAPPGSWHALYPIGCRDSAGSIDGRLPPRPSPHRQPRMRQLQFTAPLANPGIGPPAPVPRGGAEKGNSTLYLNQTRQETGPRERRWFDELLALPFRPVWRSDRAGLVGLLLVTLAASTLLFSGGT